MIHSPLDAVSLERAAFMGLSMRIPGLFAGDIQEALGYKDFFWMVIACCVATIAVTFFAYHKVDPAYGKK